MKKLFLLISIAFIAAFAEPEGKYVDVELLSGTHQRAKFLGIENDTVSLGGYIQNKFTVVKIAKKQFKKIVDEQGNDLLNEENAKNALVKDTVASTQATTAKDTFAKENTKKATQSSSSNISNESSSSSATKKEPLSSSIAPRSSSVASSSSVSSSSSVAPAVEREIKSVLVAYDAEGNVDKSFADQFTALTARLLYESGEKPQTIRKGDINNCNDNVCIQSELASMGFNSIYFGNISHDTRTDSLRLNLTHAFYEDSLPTLHQSTISVSEKTALSDAITNNKLKNQLLDVQGKKIIVTKKNRSYIHVETDPDGATISRSEDDAICKSPCTFVTTDTSKFTLYSSREELPLRFR